jgi:hypothetical protein
MGTCIAAGVVCVPAIRRDVLQIINTLRLLRNGPEDGAVVVEDTAGGEIASPSDERSLAVDVQRRRGDAVP